MVRGVGMLVESARKLGDDSHHHDDLLADLQLSTEVNTHVRKHNPRSQTVVLTSVIF